MAGGVFTCPRVEVPPEARRDVWGAFRSWQDRGGVVLVLCFVLLYRIGDIGMAPMLKPLWVDRGHSFEEMALISTVLQQVWGTADPIVPAELLVAIAHAGGYVATNVGSAPDGNAVPVPKDDAEKAMDAAAW